MKKNLRRWSALAFTLLVSLVAQTASAVPPDYWWTKGGDPGRSGIYSGGLGSFHPEPWWEGSALALGRSATQPIVVDGWAYHVAGDSLWRVWLEAPKGKPYYENLGLVNIDSDDPEETVQISSSTPTYSPESGMIYFGTNFGWLWRYDPKKSELRPIKLSRCAIVSSPLVLRVAGRDLVVVGDKPTGERCDKTAGAVHLVWDLDHPSAPPKHHSLTIGGWVTPSPVAAGLGDNGLPEFIIGADGRSCTEGGRSGTGIARKLRIERTGSNFSLSTRQWGASPCTEYGVAGTFAAAGDFAYWIDTWGGLYGKHLVDGAPPEKWPAQRIDLPRLTGGPAAVGFTNTEPAIDLAGGALYATLRNYVLQGETDPTTGAQLYLRGCRSMRYPVPGCTAPGGPGAILSVNLTDATLRWSARMPTGSSDRLHHAINTSPLIIKRRDLVLFGDVNGLVHSYALDPGPLNRATPAYFMTDESCDRVTTRTLLQPGETSARGEATWSQVSGVGTDPMLSAFTGATGQQESMMLIGVNFDPPEPNPAKAWQYGRLAAYRAGPVTEFNLAWTSHTLTPGPQIRQGEPAAIDGTITLKETDKRLEQLRASGVPVHWMLMRSDLTDLLQLRLGLTPDGARYLGTSGNLPGEMKAGDITPKSFSFKLQPDDAEAGLLVGMIDPSHASFNASVFFQLLAEFLAKKAGIPFDCGPTANLLETRYDDNFLLIPYQKLQPLDLEVTRLTIPAQVPCDAGATIEAEWAFQNSAAESITVRRTARVTTAKSGPLNPRQGQIRLPPGETVERVAITVANCDDTATLTVELNGDQAVTETRYDNNRLTRSTMIEIYAPKEFNFQQGEGAVIIVPPDCIRQPGPRPCSNYPDLIIPDYDGN